MSKGGVNFTKDNEYYTPRWVVDYFGGFDYDPATTREKAADLGIPSFDTIETDGLSKDWTQYRRVWINPPFTIKHQFFVKALDTYRIAHNDIYILFPAEFLTTNRFHDYGATGTLYIPRGRIKFESGLGKKAVQPAFGSLIFKFGDTNAIEYVDLNPHPRGITEPDHPKGDDAPAAMPCPCKGCYAGTECQLKPHVLPTPHICEHGVSHHNDRQGDRICTICLKEAMK